MLRKLLSGFLAAAMLTAASVTPACAGTDYYMGAYKITYYCACAKCCGKTDGITATGTKATEGRTIGVNPKVIPYGSKVYIEGLGWYVAEDTGSIKGKHIDVYVSSHQRALQLGRQYRTVWVRR